MADETQIQITADTKQAEDRLRALVGELGELTAAAEKAGDTKAVASFSNLSNKVEDVSTKLAAGKINAKEAGTQLDALSIRTRVASEAFDKSSASLQFMGVSVDRLIGRLIIMKVGLEVLKEASKQGGDELLRMAASAGALGVSVQDIRNTFDDLENGKFLSFLEDAGKGAQHAGEAVRGWWEGLSKAQIEAQLVAETVDDLITKTQGEAAATELSIQALKDKAIYLLLSGKATDANRDALQAEIAILEKTVPKHSEYRRELEAISKQLRTNIEVQDDYAKALGVQTPDQIEKGMESLRAYVAQVKASGTTTTAEADVIVNGAKKWLKAIEEIPGKHRGALASEEADVKSFIASYESLTTKFEAASKRQETAAERVQKRIHDYILGIGKDFDLNEAAVVKYADSFDRNTGRTVEQTKHVTDLVQKQLDKYAEMGVKVPDDLQRIADRWGIVTSEIEKATKAQEAEALASAKGLASEIEKSKARITELENKPLKTIDEQNELNELKDKTLPDLNAKLTDTGKAAEVTAVSTDLLAHRMFDFRGMAERAAEASKLANDRYVAQHQSTVDLSSSTEQLVKTTKDLEAAANDSQETYSKTAIKIEAVTERTAMFGEGQGILAKAVGNSDASVLKLTNTYDDHAIAIGKTADEAQRLAKGFDDVTGGASSGAKSVDVASKSIGDNLNPRLSDATLLLQKANDLVDTLAAKLVALGAV